MEGIAPRKQTMPKKASKSTTDTKVEQLEAQDMVEDLSKSQTHILNNVKDFAMAATNQNEVNAKAFYMEAISKMGIKENEINIESPWLLAATASNTATTKTKTAKTRYSAFKNAIAPSAILCPIFFILSEPSSCLLIQLVLIKENSIAIIPAPNT